MLIAHALIGGHPRSLELLDALLRQGRSEQTQLATKLRQLARTANIDTARSATLADAIADTVTLSATDMVLDQLAAVLSPVERETLLQVAVSNLPVAAADLATLVADGDHMAAHWGVVVGPAG